jgi:hypothetical protein
MNEMAPSPHAPVRWRFQAWPPIVLFGILDMAHHHTSERGKTKLLATHCSNAMDARVTSAFPLLDEGPPTVSQDKETAWTSNAL